VIKAKSTLDQLPADAASYYAGAEQRGGLFTRVLLGRDGMKRRVYQLYFDGEPYGAPRALRTYQEYVASVKRAYASARGTPIGVSRWTEPYDWRE
jgi:hypothetical protein